LGFQIRLACLKLEEILPPVLIALYVILHVK